MMLQDEGMKARAWGMSNNNNPLLLAILERSPPAGRNPDWWVRYDAWCFGWQIEDTWLTEPSFASAFPARND
ncbi:MAG: CrpP-related protein [Allorhizobium sp.]